jgi:glycosyltransferase involved in cell wall biosynthesis
MLSCLENRFFQQPVKPNVLPLPVFLISFNRGAMLERTIVGLRKMAQPTQIIVHDNGSTDPGTLAVLARLRAEEVIVVSREPIKSADELNKVNETVQAFFTANVARNYVVSDCDIDISVADPHAFAVYAELLALFPDVLCVGPMLRIRDVPRTYPLFNRVMNRHIEQFWIHSPSWAQTSIGRVAYLAAPIDTTMALHRAGQPFFRLKPGLRVYEPYEARHLDWYIRPGEATSYTNTSNGNISHWDNRSEYERYCNVNLEYLSYRAVRIGPGGLEEYEEKIAGG